MENMNYEFKDMATIDVAESVSDDAHVLVEDEGVIKRVHKSHIVCETETEVEESGGVALPFTVISKESHPNYFTDDGLSIFDVPDGRYLCLTNEIYFLDMYGQPVKQKTGGMVIFTKENDKIYFHTLVYNIYTDNSVIYDSFWIGQDASEMDVVYSSYHRCEHDSQYS